MRITSILVIQGLPTRNGDIRILIQRLHTRFDKSLGKPVVVTQPHEVVASSKVEYRVEIRGWAQVFRLPHIGNSLVFYTDTLTDRTSVVRRGVVGDQHLYVLKCLISK